MNLQIKLRYVIIAVALIGGLIWLSIHLLKARYDSRVDELNTALYHAHQDITNYEITVDNLAEYASEVELQVVDKDSKIFKLEEEKERLKELNIRRVTMIGRMEAQIRILRDSIKPVGPTDDPDAPWVVSFPVTTEDDGGFKLSLPVQYSYEDRWARLVTDIDKVGFGSFDFSIKEVPLNIVVGEKKMGLFKPRSDVAIVTTPNPYVSFDESKMALVDNSPSPWKYVAVGSATTVGVALAVKFLLLPLLGQ